MAQNKKLYNIINVQGEDYEVTATSADMAAKVENQLILKENTLIMDASDTVTDLITESQASYEPAVFDGTKEQTISFVSADGGKYRGPVLLEGLNNYKLLDSFKDNHLKKIAVNVEDVESLVGNMKGCPFGTWDGTNLAIHRVDDADPTSDIKEINIVFGDEVNIDSYIANLERLNMKYSFYICSNDPFNLYFINDTGNRVRLNQHAVSADTATHANMLKDLISEVTPETFRRLGNTVYNINTAINALQGWYPYIEAAFTDMTANEENAEAYLANDVAPVGEAYRLKNAASATGTGSDFFKVYITTDEPAEAADGSVWIKLPS